MELKRTTIKGNDHADLAQALEVTYETTRDPWLISRASAEWRKAHSPGDALRVTDVYFSLDGNVKAAALTSRGGALCDLARWAEARACAMQALEAYERETHHAHMLLMRIHINLGEEKLADAALTRARELGLSARGQEQSIGQYVAEIRSAEEQKTIMASLVTLNPKRYQMLARQLGSAAKSQ